MHGGRYGSRGYYLQGLVSVFESVKDNKWTSIQVEPEQEKIDIIIEFKDKSTKAIQVKSTKNTFSETLIKQTLEAIINANKTVSHYEVILIGDLNENAKKFMNNIEFNRELNLDKDINISKKNISIKNMPLDIEMLTVEVKQHLNRYLDHLGYEVKPYGVKVLNDSLIGESLLFSTDGSKLLRENFEDNLITFAELLTKDSEDNNSDNQVSNIISEKAMKIYKRNKLIRKVSLLFTIFLLINPIIKLYDDALTKLDILGIGIFASLIIGIIFLFKISDSKFRELEDKESEAYKKNTNDVKNEICKIKVIDNVDYKNNRREVYSQIILNNLTGHIIDYVEGEVEFYHGSTRVYLTQFSEKEINSYGNILLYNRPLSPNKAKNDWSSFRVKITKLITENKVLKDITLYSGSKFKTYSTLLNSYYLPVIYELFGYESSWAMEVIKDQFWKVRHYVKYINIRRFLILLGYTLICLFILVFSLIGIYNFLYIPIKLIFN
ncbi:hypothetical protein I5677_09420 [Mobilitalea sibirica]|uniref:Uncharacterized protein n=1 Tax=Mobilitalea sibirica TaxID=1462919 RepID=A0A8J7GZ76_9FIRM|nr:hypothetical protein [Mobilitalea sibirica]MBH1941109.1 hypothetical protein [Mobilitalea sibirica]